MKIKDWTKENEIKEQIKQNVDIVDVVNYYIDLKKKGSSFKTLCPFHSEKTPSFSVDKNKQAYYCFGCGASGDVFQFVMDIEKIGFQEAVNKVAMIGGLPLRINQDMDYDNSYYYPIQKRTPKEIKYYSLDDFKDYKRYNAILGGGNLTQLIKDYNNYPKEMKLKIIYTFLYYKSLSYKEQFISEFNDFYSKRGIDIQHPLLKVIGYIPKKALEFKNKSDYIVDILIKYFGKEDLLEFKILRENNGYLNFASYVKEGGFCVVPNHSLNDDLIAGLVFRYTKPINKIKELALRNSDVVTAFPFGLTLNTLKNKNIDTLIIAEGHIDSASIKYKSNEMFISFQGVNNWSNYLKPYTKLLQSKNILICFDQDEAGRKGAIKLKETYNSLGVNNVDIISWDKELGKDLNDLLQNKCNVREILGLDEKKVVDYYEIDVSN